MKILDNLENPTGTFKFKFWILGHPIYMTEACLLHLNSRLRTRAMRRERSLEEIDRDIATIWKELQVKYFQGLALAIAVNLECLKEF